MSDKVKLTRPQRAHLRCICREGPKRSYTGYKPAVNLVRLGLAEWEMPNAYTSRLRPTEDGRAYCAAHLSLEAQQ